MKLRLAGYRREAVMRASQCRCPLPPVVLVVAGCLLSTVARADAVFLKNKAAYVGRIVSEDAGSVTIVSQGAEWTFSRARIDRVTRNAAESAHERSAERARERAKVAKEKAVAVVDHPARKPAGPRADHAPVPGREPSPPAGHDPFNGQGQRLQQLTHQPVSGEGLEPVAPGGVW